MVRTKFGISLLFVFALETVVVCGEVQTRLAVYLALISNNAMVEDNPISVLPAFFIEPLILNSFVKSNHDTSSFMFWNQFLRSVQ